MNHCETFHYKRFPQQFRFDACQSKCIFCFFDLNVQCLNNWTALPRPLEIFNRAVRHSRKLGLWHTYMYSILRSAFMDDYYLWESHFRFPREPQNSQRGGDACKNFTEATMARMSHFQGNSSTSPRHTFGNNRATTCQPLLLTCTSNHRRYDVLLLVKRIKYFSFSLPLSRRTICYTYKKPIEVFMCLSTKQG